MRNQISYSPKVRAETDQGIRGGISTTAHSMILRARPPKKRLNPRWLRSILPCWKEMVLITACSIQTVL
ncbi:hypothetical protein C8R34_1283 [Nitrosomonas sp. Nm84]|nr:hypothetical protein C8R34_1283 [Nitrosomonas sp. Nm84]